MLDWQVILNFRPIIGYFKQNIVGSGSIGDGDGKNIDDDDESGKTNTVDVTNISSTVDIMLLVI